MHNLLTITKTKVLKQDAASVRLSRACAAITQYRAAIFNLKKEAGLEKNPRNSFEFFQSPVGAKRFNHLYQ
jgi:hypothetical protein